MNRMRALVLSMLFATACPFAAGAADAGKIVYGAGNCFIIQTAKGFTLFERSGGATPKAQQVANGVLHDFGYQQLYDGNGKELMVGFVQDFGVKKETTVQAFKKVCR